MSYKLRKMREGITDDQPNTPTVFNEKQVDTIGKLGGKEESISWAEAHGRLNISKGNKSKRKQLNEFDQKSFSREQASKEFPKNDPSNVSTLRLSSKRKNKTDKIGGLSFSTSFTKQKSKFKAVEDNELLKHVRKGVSKSAGFRLGNIGSSASVGRSSSREEVRPITPAAAERKGNRWQRRQERKNKKK
ncbi:MAG: hypothetical protein HN905_03250 [Candidatus Marinimicrobia bacterium]|jgi:hypothetical protein|nr:hypothetical protein [Candidatus Neomarinimicrobiota bacterium]